MLVVCSYSVCGVRVLMVCARYACDRLGVFVLYLWCVCVCVCVCLFSFMAHKYLGSVCAVYVLMVYLWCGCAGGLSVRVVCL